MHEVLNEVSKYMLACAEQIVKLKKGSSLKNEKFKFKSTKRKFSKQSQRPLQLATLLVNLNATSYFANL